MEMVQLNNNVLMPQLGFGVFKVGNAEAEKAVSEALRIGYRSIDTATVYGNESGVGQAISKSGIEREQLFITTKVWNSDQGYENTLAAFNQSLDKLKLDYVDLYLIHWPTPKYDLYIETYKALEKLYQEGRIRAIGVSNFEVEHLERIINECSITPAVNQVECHPYFTQKELKSFCSEKTIAFEAWSPLQRGRELLQDPALYEIASVKKKTVAQIVLRWHLQENSIVIPKSVTPARILENLQVFDFELSPEEMNIIDQLNKNERCGSNPHTNNRR
ncbi:aldo/keto reductase [Alkalihalobacillus pseudalcaliphilus]|uniref:aldo/keto reductase n=1 Tax=Alkalihalobacillus pseudalcaliphilus TaxID=79884 RepID=UPI00064DD920|nr:aldo/keto reductase [Alkalihalobacillus pseudalcaliphilus]KMK76198.1 glyoxal reductase [Alkalihalobacillus pseudalcaliphilus]